jgi:arylsulfatase A-like enzyme
LIFTSDNGCSPQANFKELTKVSHSPSHIYRGHKADIYEGGHRIPFIVRWPARIKAGSKSAATTCLTDLMATAADITGTKMPENSAEDSISILPALTSNQPQVREDIIHHSINGSFAIRQGDWKLIFCPGSGGWSSPRPSDAFKKKLPLIQLYNLSTDPGEQKNVYKANIAKVKELYALLAKQIELGRSTAGLPQKNEGETPFTPKGFEGMKAELGL